MLLTKEQITEAVRAAAEDYPVQSVYLYGSYADDTATETSDVDLYVVFSQSPVSFFKVMGFRARLERVLRKEVDVVKSPPDGEGMVRIYEA